MNHGLYYIVGKYTFAGETRKKRRRAQEKSAGERRRAQESAAERIISLLNSYGKPYVVVATLYKDHRRRSRNNKNKKASIL